MKGFDSKTCKPCKGTGHVRSGGLGLLCARCQSTGRRQAQITRATGVYVRHRGKTVEVIARMTQEGIWLKYAGSPWRRAFLCPWRSALDVGVERFIREERERKKKARAERKAARAS